MTDLDIRRPDRQPYELGDRYRSGSGPVVLTGVQAIARALVEQHERDARAGLRVATFVSGYQGSPLGGVDRMLAGMPDVLAAHDITFVPGLNEELAATSVWGSQADRVPEGARALTTASSESGTARGQAWTGPPTRSGTPTCTAPIRAAECCFWSATTRRPSRPPCPPSASARWRRSGSRCCSRATPARSSRWPCTAWRCRGRPDVSVALKIVADVADGAWSVDGSVADVDIVVPEVHLGRKAVRLPAATDGARRPTAWTPRPTSTDPAPRSCAPTVPPTGSTSSRSIRPNATIGIAATGTTFDSVRQALADLGVDDVALAPGGHQAAAHRHAARRLGRMRSPSFAEGLDEILVVEDKTRVRRDPGARNPLRHERMRRGSSARGTRRAGC